MFFFSPLTGKHLITHVMQIITGLLITNAAYQLHIVFKASDLLFVFSPTCKTQTKK